MTDSLEQSMRDDAPSLAARVDAAFDRFDRLTRTLRRRTEFARALEALADSLESMPDTEDDQ